MVSAASTEGVPCRGNGGSARRRGRRRRCRGRRWTPPTWACARARPPPPWALRRRRCLLLLLLPTLQPNHWSAGERRAVKEAGGARGGKEGIGVPGCDPSVASRARPHAGFHPVLAQWVGGRRAVGEVALLRPPATSVLPRCQGKSATATAPIRCVGRPTRGGRAGSLFRCVEFLVASKIYGPVGRNSLGRTTRREAQLQTTGGSALSSGHDLVQTCPLAHDLAHSLPIQFWLFIDLKYSLSAILFLRTDSYSYLFATYN
jgi:hypothetical protein